MKTGSILTTIFIVLFAITGVNAQSVEKLFNGKNLSNWEFVVDKNIAPAEKVFSVKDSVINIDGTLGYMYTKKKYSNYVLNVEWRWPEEASNSGIFLLIKDPKNPFPNGIECQLKSGNAGDFVLLGGSDIKEFKNPKGQPRPNFPVVEKIAKSSERPVGEWNCAKIVVANGVMIIYINGVLQNKGTNKVKTGHIGLQSEGKAIQFRNVTIVEF